MYNKLARISERRDNNTLRRRVIWNMLRSRVNMQERVSERIVLPRVSDAVKDAVDMARAAGQGESLEWFVNRRGGRPPQHDGPAVPKLKTQFAYRSVRNLLKNESGIKSK